MNCNYKTVLQKKICQNSLFLLIWYNVRKGKSKAFSKLLPKHCEFLIQYLQIQEGLLE